jgi:hypothetical protein
MREKQIERGESSMNYNVQQPTASLTIQPSPVNKSYDDQASELIHSFIADYGYVKEIIDDLVKRSPDYTMELVLNWETYKDILVNFRGKNVSLQQIADKLGEALKRNVNTKLSNELTIANIGRPQPPQNVPLLTQGETENVPSNNIHKADSVKIDALGQVYFTQTATGQTKISDHWESADVLRRLLWDTFNSQNANDTYLKNLFKNMNEAQLEELESYYNNVLGIGIDRDTAIKGVLTLVHNLGIEESEQQDIVYDANKLIGNTYSNYKGLLNENDLKHATTEAIALITRELANFAKHRTENAHAKLEETKEERDKAIIKGTNNEQKAKKIAHILHVISNGNYLGNDKTETEAKKKQITNYMKNVFGYSDMRTNISWKNLALNVRDVFDSEETDPGQLKDFIILLWGLTQDVESDYKISPYDETIGLGFGKQVKFGEKGRYYIDTKVLDSGLLEVRYSKNKHLINLKSMHISAKMRDLVYLLLNDKKIELIEYAKLTFMEKHVLSIVASKFGKGLDNDTSQDLNNEFEVCKAELLNGNNSEIIRAKVRHMIGLKADMGHISRASASKMISDLRL